MRALRKTAPRPGAELEDVPVPDPGEGEVLVRVHAASICGTDLHIFDWNEWAQGRVTRVPMTFGHEVAGTVEAVGPEVHHVQRGAFVAVETHIACGVCSTCRTGRAHICRNLKILGVDTDGAFAEYVVVPAVNAWVVGEGIQPDHRVGDGTVRERRACDVRDRGRRGPAHEPGRGHRVRSDRPVRGRDRARARGLEGDRDRTQRRTPVARGEDGCRPVDRSEGRRSGRGGARRDGRQRRGGRARDVGERDRDRSGDPAAGPRGPHVAARAPGRAGDAGPERSGDLQGGPDPGDHRTPDVPDVAADDDLAVHGTGRHLPGHHASVPAGSVRGGVRDGRARATPRR